MTLQDWRGLPINEGDTIVYSTRQGSSMTIVEAVVKQILPDGNMKVRRIRENWGTGKASAIDYSHRFSWSRPKELVTLSTMYVTKIGSGDNEQE